MCNTRKLRGDPGTLGFNQHKTAVTICRNKQQHQVRVIAGNILLLWGGGGWRFDITGLAAPRLTAGESG